MRRDVGGCDWFGTTVAPPIQIDVNIHILGMRHKYNGG